MQLRVALQSCFHGIKPNKLGSIEGYKGLLVPAFRKPEM